MRTTTNQAKKRAAAKSRKPAKRSVGGGLLTARISGSMKDIRRAHEHAKREGWRNYVVILQIAARPEDIGGIEDGISEVIWDAGGDYVADAENLLFQERS